MVSAMAITPVTTGMRSVDGFEADVVLPDIERRCRCTAWGWRRADVLPDYKRAAEGEYQRRVHQSAIAFECSTMSALVQYRTNSATYELSALCQ